MNKMFQKIAGALTACLLFSALPAEVVSAAGWIRSGTPGTEDGRNSGWWYSLSDDDSQWYAASGEETVAWHWIDGNRDGAAECYAFDASGWMYADTVTPDGYTVDRNGAWTVDGAVQVRNVPVAGGRSGGNVSRKSGGSPGSGDSGGGSAGSCGSGNGNHSGSEEHPDPSGPQAAQVTYTVILADESGHALKEIRANGMIGETVSFSEYTVPGYELKSGQPLSAVLEREEMVFRVYFEKLEQETASGSDAARLLSYRIEYIDIDTKTVLAAEVGQAEKGTVIEIPAADIEGYAVCPDQREEFKLLSDKTVQKIYYEYIAIASPSETQKVKWQVHFVDREDRAMRLWPSQSGTIQDEGILTINFPETIRTDDSVWESTETPPVERVISGPGQAIEYIEFVRAGDLPEETDPEEGMKELLQSYLEQARQYEAEITGEEPEKIPDSRFIVTDQEKNDVRVRSIANQINDTRPRTFYVVGKNFVPNGKTLAEWFGDGAGYSNLLEEVIHIGTDTYYVARMGVWRKFSREGCTHSWDIERENGASCLGKGAVLYVCERCGDEREVTTAPLGHTDQNRDSICDRCGRRAFLQHAGDGIRAELNGKELTFTCISEEYGGGMLYLADQTVSLEMFGGYGGTEYGDSNVFRYFRDGFQNGFSIKTGILGTEITGTSGTAYAFSLSREEYDQYRERVTGADFLLRDSENGQVLGVSADGSYSWQDAPATDYGIRPAIVLEIPDTGQPDRIHWNTGDVQAREIDGETYMFRCIDQNYSDGDANHRQAALFLAETVIPANYGSDYELEETDDGSHQYIFTPGPVVSFGDSNDYKYSRIRQWLGESEENFFNTEPIRIGVDYAFMGSTAEKEYSGFDSNDIRACYIGDQQLTERVFILSVDEAMEYREYLWKFDGSEEENPDSQYSAYSKGYWLRSPMGNRDDYDTGYAYVVDLVNGNIHPAAVKPEGVTGEEELDTTSVYGIRLAFTMPQD